MHFRCINIYFYEKMAFIFWIMLILLLMMMFLGILYNDIKKVTPNYIAESDLINKCKESNGEYHAYSYTDSGGMERWSLL